MAGNIKDIIEGLLSDSPQAMKRLFDMFYKPLCNHAKRFVGNMPVAEEIVSDVMYKIWLNRHQGYRAETFLEYLYAATHNTALNHIKQQENLKKLSYNWADKVRNELIEETPLDIMIEKETQDKLKSLMNSLPEQCRKAFMMSRMGNMNYEEIAGQMNISTNTVKYHIKTALQKLRVETDRLFVLLLLFWSFSVIILQYVPTLFIFSIVLLLYIAS